MAISSENQGSIGTTPVQLTINGGPSSRLTIVKASGGDYYLGSSNSVSSSTGLKVTAGIFGPIDINASDPIYAVTASGTVTLHTDTES